MSAEIPDNNIFTDAIVQIENLTIQYHLFGVIGDMDNRLFEDSYTARKYAEHLYPESGDVTLLIRVFEVFKYDPQ